MGLFIWYVRKIFRKTNVTFLSLLKSMGLGSNWYQIGNKTYYILKVSKFYAEKRYQCLKMPSLPCKCEFYRPEKNAKGGLKLNLD